MTACRPGIINVKQATKQTVFPGVEGAPINIKYTVRFNLSKPVQLKTVHFENKNTTFEFNTFLLKNLDTNKIYKANQTLPEGNYVFETSIPKKKEVESKKDFLVFTVKFGNKTYDYKVELQQGENIFMP